MALRTLDSLGSLSGKTVLVRCDLNVPLKDGVITDDGRIRASLPTGETSKDEAVRGEFAAQLAAFGDAMVSDGFGVVHRKQASVYDLAKLLPSAAGLLIENELGVLERLTESPERPYTVVLGGSKVSDKLGVISHLLPRVNTILVGGGMVFTFLKAQGYNVGSSLLEEDQLDTVRGYIAEAAERGVTIVLPTDIVMASKFARMPRPGSHRLMLWKTPPLAHPEWV